MFCLSDHAIDFVFHDVDADGMLAKEIIIQNSPNIKYHIPYTHNRTEHLKILEEVIEWHNDDCDDGILSNEYLNVNIILADCYFYLKDAVELISDKLALLSEKCKFNFIIFDHHQSNAENFRKAYCPEEDFDKIYKSPEEALVPYRCTKTFNDVPVEVYAYFVKYVCAAKIIDRYHSPELYLDNMKYKDDTAIGIVDYVNDIDVWDRLLLPESLELNIALDIMHTEMTDTESRSTFSCNCAYKPFFSAMIALEKSGRRKGNREWEDLFNATKEPGVANLAKSLNYGRNRAKEFVIHNTAFGKGLMFFAKGYNLNTVASEIYNIRGDADFVFSVIHNDYIHDRFTLTFRSRNSSEINLGEECCKYANGKGGGHHHAAGMTISFKMLRKFLGLDTPKSKELS